MTIIDSPFQQSDPNIVSSCSSNPYFKNETGSAYFTLV
jgi:hypothetical protein